VFYEFSIFNAGGTRGFARAAIQAFIDMIDEHIADGKLAFVHQNHLAYAAARRIGLEMPEFVGGAMIQAQAAVNAAGVILVSGNEAGNRLLGGQF